MKLSLGFTLFEIMLVIGIAAAITAGSVLGLSALQSSFTVRSVADEIRGEIELGREMAIANMNNASYRIGASSGVVILSADGNEVSRYQLPKNVILDPVSFSWSFTPVSGSVGGCSASCTITITLGGNSETISVNNNGIID